jgi:hypothetical protein
MIPAWTKRATEDGFYICIVDGLELEDGEIHFIDASKELGTDYENLWLFGPFPGYPTINHGIIDA